MKEFIYEAYNSRTFNNYVDIEVSVGNLFSYVEEDAPFTKESFTSFVDIFLNYAGYEYECSGSVWFYKDGSVHYCLCDVTDKEGDVVKDYYGDIIEDINDVLPDMIGSNIIHDMVMELLTNIKQDIICNFPNNKKA